MPVFLMKMIVLCEILLGPHAHLLGPMDDVLALNLHQDLLLGSVQWYELFVVIA